MNLLSATRWKGFLSVVVIGLVLLIAAWQDSAQAIKEPDRTTANEALSDQDFQEWLAALRAEARGKGISDTTLDAALSDILPVKHVIELDRRQPEFTQTFWAYLRRRVTDDRIIRGRALLAKHRDLLNKICAEYGIPPRYLIAFWGLETDFGDYLGNFRVIDALATLAFDRRRTDFFRAELLSALQIIDEGHITPDAMMGSWAGAMGHMQFMPSTFTIHAVDFTGDGRKDIWGSLPDAFSSAANFLSNIGWRTGEIWGREVRLPENFDLTLATMDRKKSLKDWASIGVRRSNGKALPQENMEGSIILPQGHNGPAFLVYNNFRTILRWNRSINYAISVGHLSDRIIGLSQIANGRGAEHEPLMRDEITEIQQLLNILGFNAGSDDGLAGPRTHTAIRPFQKENLLPPDGYPSPALLKLLRSQPIAPF
jgi:membrane-bound lytic murein transglycosylase B